MGWLLTYLEQEITSFILKILPVLDLHLCVWEVPLVGQLIFLFVVYIIPFSLYILLVVCTASFLVVVVIRISLIVPHKWLS